VAALLPPHCKRAMRLHASGGRRSGSRRARLILPKILKPLW
jgi:hypothetical protein